ncbi:hypothetical protein GCM10009069_19430 [Algimonas arctica]|uniref:DUF3604 domain-containing protein n=1 Tax=Algimonas arctica TaxID=1479486 RepID=A0A8J3G2L7_9PROT|nr:DUF3604 domain-containing protein [Algimonas arctica]GHA96509.1 hypothetical protein GCM10009069_19430 [Algimonas arctica]
MKRLMLGVALIALAGCNAAEQPVEPPAPVALPAAEIIRTPTKVALFGDLHIHTENSFDAYIFGTRASPDDAYAFARGRTIDNGAGTPITLSGPPLDFYSVTDHGEYLGVVKAMRDRKNPLSDTATAKSIFAIFAQNRRANFLRIGRSVVQGDPIEDIYDRAHIDSVWSDTVAAAERHNAPGTFTTFAGYEFTAMTQVTEFGAANLHRNVIFKDGAPDRLFTTLDSPNPEDLWDWMDQQRDEGFELLSIPHNSNASNGQMFAQTQTDGSAFTPSYVVQRIRNEPLVEITQVKGTSETHPQLAPNDEWANFEIYRNLIGSNEPSTVVPGSFVRNALAQGLGMDVAGLGNPYEFGVIGSSDTHLGAPSLSEKDHFGKFPHDMDNDMRRSVPSDKKAGWAGESRVEDDLVAAPQYGASGLAGVWAEANTRADIFDAMRARETFATSGPRLKVRMFMGDYTPSDLMAADMLERAYAAGVPMGATRDTAGTVMAMGYADPEGEPLERLQIIALRADGSEEIYDVACAANARIDPNTHRCDLPTGKVDLSSCQSEGVGSGELSALWNDPNPSADQPAAYYLRALERPKCRWSTWDAVRAGTPPSSDMESVIQDRAWSSAIWVKP